MDDTLTVRKCADFEEMKAGEYRYWLSLLARERP
jgi:hypothetical protein